MEGKAQIEVGTGAQHAYGLSVNRISLDVAPLDACGEADVVVDCERHGGIEHEVVAGAVALPSYGARGIEVIGRCERKHDGIKHTVGGGTDVRGFSIHHAGVCGGGTL